MESHPPGAELYTPGLGNVECYNVSNYQMIHLFKASETLKNNAPHLGCRELMKIWQN